MLEPSLAWTRCPIEHVFNRIGFFKHVQQTRRPFNTDDATSHNEPQDSANYLRAEATILLV